MAAPIGTAPSPVTLEEALCREPYRFDLFQALRRLECEHADRPRLGESSRPTEDAVRLGQEPSLAFAPSTIASFSPAEAQRPARLGVYAFGLFGPNGPLPLHLTEYARDRQRNHADRTFEAFADLFHHRMLSLLYRAWAEAEPSVSFDRPDADRFALYVGALFGLGMRSLRDRDELPDATRLHFAGRLACPTRGDEGLRDLVADFLGVPAEVETFVGEWVELPPESLCRLDDSPEAAALGATAVLGRRLWTRDQRFRLVLGPLSLPEYRRLLPGGGSLKRLAALVRSYTGNVLGWDVRLVLRCQEAPPPTLGSGMQLGFTCWVHSAPPERDLDDLVLTT